MWNYNIISRNEKKKLKISYPAKFQHIMVYMYIQEMGAFSNH